MTEEQNPTAATSPRIDELKKAIYSLRLSEIQELLYDVKPLPPTKLVSILVVRDPKNPKNRILQLKQEFETLYTNEQIGWTSPSGRVEIRFSRNATPFLGDIFEVPRGGKAYSGLPTARLSREQVFRYTILITTPDGFFLSKEIDLKIAPPPRPSGKAEKK